MRSDAWQQRLVVAWLTVAAGFWSAFVLSHPSTLANDFGAFWGATRAAFANGAAAAYDVDLAAQQLQAVARTAQAGPLVLTAAPAPYPPVFFALFAPFALLPPLPGFVLWTLLNVVLAIGAMVTVARRFQRHRPQVVANMLLFLPFTISLYLGQPTGLLLFALAQAFVSFQSGKDGRAGLWLTILLLKPQYVVVLLLVLLVKRRWRALAGSAVGGAAFLLVSLLVARANGLIAFISMLRAVGSFRAAPGGIAPTFMMGWRGLLLNLFPRLGDTQGLLFALALSAITVVALLLAWREPWDPADARFPARLLAVLLATLLACYHDHLHGAALLLVPGGLLAACGMSRALTACAILGQVVPYALFLSSGSSPLLAIFLTALMAVSLAILLLTAVRPIEKIVAPNGGHRLVPLPRPPLSSKPLTGS